MSGLNSIDDLQAGSDGENLSTDLHIDHVDNSGRTENAGHVDKNRPVVLVVDDSKTVLCSATDFLTDIGLSVVTASDGFEALAKVVDTKPAMLFVDIMMPRLDGYQTCALIKNNADFRAIPVIILSSKDGLFDRARGRVAGANDHLVKPFDAAQISAMVEKHLGAAVISGTAVVTGVTNDADATISS